MPEPDEAGVEAAALGEDLSAVRDAHQPARDLHTKDGSGVCVTCGVKLPCPTLRALMALERLAYPVRAFRSTDDALVETLAQKIIPDAYSMFAPLFHAPDEAPFACPSVDDLIRFVVAQTLDSGSPGGAEGDARGKTAAGIERIAYVLCAHHQPGAHCGAYPHPQAQLRVKPCRASMEMAESIAYDLDYDTLIAQVSARATPGVPGGDTELREAATDRAAAEHGSQAPSDTAAET